MIADLTPEAELAALKDLVESDGWQVYQAHVAKAWGAESCLEKIDEALKGAHVDDELAIAKRIRDTFKGVNAEARWVTTRMQELKAAIEHKPVKMFDRFAGLRRGPR